MSNKLAIMQHVLSDQRYPAADPPVGSQILTYSQHVRTIIREVIVKQHYDWIQPTKAQPRAAQNCIVDGSLKLIEVIARVTPNLAWDHTERALEAAPPRCFHQMNNGTNSALGEDAVVEGIGRNARDRRSIDPL